MGGKTLADNPQNTTAEGSQEASTVDISIATAKITCLEMTIVE